MAVETLEPEAHLEEQEQQEQEPKRPARRRPGRPPKDGKQAKKRPALYHLYERDPEGVLSPLADQEAKTAEGAVTVFLKSPPSDLADFVEQVKNGEAVVVAIPERNYTIVGAEEEIKTRLRIKARK